jgi:hypothetical protein
MFDYLENSGNSPVSTFITLLEKGESIRKSEGSNQNLNSLLEPNQEFFDEFERSIIDYFTTNPNSDLKNATRDLSKQLTDLQVVAIDFLIKNKSLDPNLENSISNEINRIILNPYLLNSELGFYALDSFSKIDFKVINESIEKLKIHDTTELSTFILSKYIVSGIVFHKRPMKSLPPELFHLIYRFKDLIISTYEFDLGLILYDLMNTNKINISSEKLSEFIKQTNITYTRGKVEFDKFYQGELKFSNFLQIKEEELKHFIFNKDIKEELLDTLWDIIKKTASFKNLGDNWDEEGALAIHYSEIQAAISNSLNIFYSTLKTPSFAAPTFHSGVLIEYQNNSERIDIRFEKDSAEMTFFIRGKLNYKGNINMEIISSLYQ